MKKLTAFACVLVCALVFTLQTRSQTVCGFSHTDIYGHVICDDPQGPQGAQANGFSHTDSPATDETTPIASLVEIATSLIAAAVAR